ncbi:histone deacetylase [Psychroflexus sp. ALD_RP9]|uniref:histone deacetylase family protein n=1 Tax=Psychroflexus sp. ALD_RP9 TaxID=2777186 RepID=UPI001A8DDBA9|nr:histone deacetylase [Psychroflexus sp. ALD_RP9]QSS98085.1 histone deacetylase [Psychroflexus sp. ALD_RP9]
MLKIAFHPIYKHPLPEGHRFPMEKYDLLPKQLLHEGTCEKDHFFEPQILPEHEIYIKQAHDEAYITNLYNLDIEPRKARKIGFPLSAELVERERLITNGTIQACNFALKNGIAMNIAGGTHHAYRDHGEAFCMINDQAVAAYYLLNNNLAKQILIIDLDVHQGNGTAQIFENDNRVYTFSMHGKSNYPFKKETSNLDIALKNDTNDDQFLSTLEAHLPQLINKLQPDFIFYLSGVDILATDKLGKLGCSIQGCKKRDEYVLNLCKTHNIPVEISMGGGYSKDIKHIIEAHANTYRVAQNLFY